MFRRKSRRQNCATEALEVRELMSAQPIASLSADGVLTITGSNRSDNIWVVRGNNGATVVDVKGGRGQIGKFSSDAIQSIRADLGSGNDSLTIRARFGDFKSIDVKMGTGVNELVEVTANHVDNIAYDVALSLNTKAYVLDTTVGSLTANFGNDQDLGPDRMVLQNSSIDTVFASMGGDRDEFVMRGSRVGAGTVRMGSGDDTFGGNATSSFRGDVFGGQGFDTFYGSSLQPRIRKEFDRFLP